MIKALGSGSGTPIPNWSALPAGTQGDKAHVTLDGVAAVAERAASLWHPAYPTKAQLASLWPSADQFPGVRVGPMRKYWQAKAEQRPIKILIQGDSNCVGQGTTAGNVGCRDVSWPKLLATRLGWRDGSACCMNIANADSRVTPGTWIANAKNALGCAWYSSTSGQSISFSPGIPFDSLIVTGLAVNGGTSTVYIDEVSVGTINHNVGLNGSLWLPQVSVTVTRGLHTVRVQCNGGACWVNMFETYDSQSTVPELLHCGVADANMSDLVSGGTQRYDARWRLQQLRPDIALFAATINDLDDNWAVNDITAGMTTARRNIRESGGDFIGICGWATNRPTVTKTNLDLLSAHLLTLSQEDGTAWVDNRAVLGYTYATTNPAHVADAWHPNAPGHVVMENQIRRIFE